MVNLRRGKFNLIAFSAIPKTQQSAIIQMTPTLVKLEIH